MAFSRRKALLACALGLTTLPVWAQDYPNRTITMVIPYSAGGPTDAMARMLATAIRPVLGQTMIVENKAGGGSNIGAEYVARAQPDGYTLMLGTSAPLAINQYLYANLKYDPLKSFAPVIQVGYLPNVLLVNPSVPVKNARELIAYTQANPGKVSFASSGSGASSHLAGVLFNEMTGTKLLHVPYKGTGPALNDLLGGQVDMTFTDILTAMPYIKTDKVKALGVATAKRSSAMPDIPTIAEQGVKGYDVSVFFGVVAPKGTPADRIKVLNQAFSRALDSDRVKQSFAQQGLEGSSDRSPAYLAKFIKSEVDKWAKVVKQAGVQLD